MRNILLFIKNSSKRNWIAFFLVLLEGLLLCVICTTTQMVSEKSVQVMSVAVMNEENDRISDCFIRYLNGLGVKTISGEDYDFYSNELIERRISAIIEIPKDYEEQGILNQELGNLTVTTLDDYENTVFIELYVNSFLESVNRFVHMAQGKEEMFYELMDRFEAMKIPLTVQNAYETDTEIERVSAGILLAAGFYSMFIFFVTMTMAFLIHEDRMSGVYERIKTTAVNAYQYIFGSILLIVLLGCIPSFLFIGYLRFTDTMEVIPYHTLFLFMFLFNLMAVSFCLMTATVCKSRMSLLSGIIAFSSVGPILGGAYFPITGLSGVIDKMSKLAPHYWYMEALRGKIADRSADMSIYVIILLLFSAFFLLITGGRFIQKEKGRM